MGRKKGKGKNYFDAEVNDAIIQFNISEKRSERERLFSNLIYPALNKLVENIIHKWKFYNYENTYIDLKAETVTYLYQQLDKYKPETGSKAFSYFTIIARNYLIKQSKDLVSRNKSHSDLMTVDPSRNLMVEVTNEQYRETLSEFLKYWCKYVHINIDDIFIHPRDKSICLAFLNILENSVEIDLFNKKLIYIYIKEQTGLSTSVHITKVMKLLKDSFHKNFEIYSTYGCIFNFEGNYNGE